MRTSVLLATALLLAACGNDPNGNSSFETGFRTSFKTKFAEQCVSSARTASHNASIDFTPVCACAADKLLATKSISDLMNGPSEADGQAVIQQCVKEHPLRPSA